MLCTAGMLLQHERRWCTQLQTAHDYIKRIKRRRHGVQKWKVWLRAIWSVSPSPGLQVVTKAILISSQSPKTSRSISGVHICPILHTFPNQTSASLCLKLTKSANQHLSCSQMTTLYTTKQSVKKQHLVLQVDLC